MFTEIVRQLKIAILSLIFLSIITGVIYPLVMTGLAQLLFPNHANGSFIKQNYEIKGSLLIAQPFNSDNYFWGRPSATTPFPDNAASSTGSNLATDNLALITAVKARINLLKDDQKPIPVDLVTASGSGLDPEISPWAAFYQADRVAKARGLTQAQVINLIQQSIQSRQFVILGEPRVNVLQLNLLLDQWTKNHG